MLERGRAKTGRRDLIASGCHDPSGTLYLLHPIRLIVSYQSMILRRTSRRLRCSSLFTSQPACPLFAPTPPVTHASLPPALPLGPPRLYTLHYTTLHSTVLLACAKPVGPATSDHFLFWTLARLQANHRRQSLAGDRRDHMSADLSTTTTLHFHRTAHASFQP